jgi:hypothetical protein
MKEREQTPDFKIVIVAKCFRAVEKAQFVSALGIVK